jgi:hypothetical protein
MNYSNYDWLQWNRREDKRINRENNIIAGVVIVLTLILSAM